MHNQIKVKCLGCSMHFVICTWQEVQEWLPPKKIYCPDCGSTGGKLIWAEPSNKNIFEVVPGQSDLASLIPFQKPHPES